MVDKPAYGELEKQIAELKIRNKDLEISYEKLQAQFAKHTEELDEANMDGVIIGKAIYEKKIHLRTLENYILNNR